MGGLASMSSTRCFYTGSYGRQEVGPGLEVGPANKSCNLLTLEMSTAVKFHTSQRLPHLLGFTPGPPDGREPPFVPGPAGFLAGGRAEEFRSMDAGGAGDGRLKIVGFRAEFPAGDWAE